MRYDPSWLEEQVDMAELPAMYEDLDDDVS